MQVLKMKNNTYKTIFAVVTMILFNSCSTTDSTVGTLGYEALSPFAASYEKITPDQVSGYDLIIVEPSHFNKSEVNALKNTGALVLAYISLGEVGDYRWYFSLMEERGFLGKNENWNTYYINLADTQVYSLFFDQIIPEIMVLGFDGLFLDTVDSVAPYTPRSYLQTDMLRLIQQIRTEYPESMIIQNAGLFLLNNTAEVVDAVLIEDVATAYNFGNKSYALKEEEAYRSKVNTIQTLSQENDIPFLIIDFAKEKPLQDMAVQRLESLEFPYFINTIELNNISSGITGNNY
jgi:polysaccharide biosynthesis protein PelA